MAQSNASETQGPDETQTSRPVPHSWLPPFSASRHSGCVSAVIGSAAVGEGNTVNRPPNRRRANRRQRCGVAYRNHRHAPICAKQAKPESCTPKSPLSYNRLLLLQDKVAAEGEKRFVGQIAHSNRQPPKAYATTIPSPPAAPSQRHHKRRRSTSKVRATLWASAAPDASKSLPTAT